MDFNGRSRYKQNASLTIKYNGNLEMDKIRNCNGKWLDVNINCEELDFKEDYFDFTLIERFRVYVFEGVDDYSEFIIKIIKDRYPSKKIYIINQNEKNEWTFRKIEDMLPYKFAYIYSGNMPKISHKYSYSSLQVMSSLCWVRRVKHPGNEDKTVLLINIGFGKGCGLGFVIRAVNTLVTIALNRDWETVVRLNGENMYVDSQLDNMWENYFVVDNERDEYLLKNSRNVIDLMENHFTYLAIYHNPYFYETWADADVHVFPKLLPNLTYKFEDKWQMQTKQAGKILGVFLRGTDGKKYDDFFTQIQFVQEQCMDIMGKRGCMHLFLATEDSRIFESFQNVFKKKLIYVDQRRITWNNKFQTIGEALEIEDGKKAAWGETYLYITYCLSKCQTFAYNIQSGAYYLAKMFGSNQIKEEYMLKMNPTEQDVLDSIVRRLETSDVIAIYGMGFIGQRLYTYLRRYSDKIVLCDKKAREIFIETTGIITPNEMLLSYFSGGISKIVIASEKYSQEMRVFLEERGVSSNDIVLYKNQEGIL